MGTPVPAIAAPPVPGLSFRTYEGERDIPAMIAVIDAAKRADGVERTDTVEQMVSAYRNLTNCEPTRDVLIAEVDGRVVAYGRVSWGQEPDGPKEYFLLGFVDPAVRRRGIGGAMLAWNEARLRAFAAGHEAHPEDHFTSWLEDGDTGGRVLLDGAGYGPSAHVATMVRPDLEDIPEAPIPPGLTVRTPRVDEMRAVWEADVEAFRDHWGFTEQTETDYRRFLEDPLADPGLWRIAWDGDRVAGQVRSFINPAENEEYHRLRGYTEEISVRRPYRRRGLARALLVRSLRALAERGMTEAALAVHMENRNEALRLYEGVGFRVTRRATEYRKPFRVPSGGRP
jgi:mycothiol synthase